MRGKNSTTRARAKYCADCVRMLANEEDPRADKRHLFSDGQNIYETLLVLHLFLHPAFMQEIKLENLDYGLGVLPFSIDEAIYDYIVVGAGTAGCVVANRLSEDRNVTVLAIEAGDYPTTESNNPAMQTILLKTPLDWHHQSQEDKHAFKCLQDHRYPMGHGKVLGGTSSINSMFYVRGDPHDFDTWAEITGDPSWAYKNVLQYFTKSENLTTQAIVNSPYGAFHGTEGNMQVTQLINSNAHNYLDSLEEIGYKSVLDINGNNTLGFSQMLLTANEKYTLRSSTANAFIVPIKNRSNLHIMKEALVTKIIVDEHKVARGVLVLNKWKRTLTVRARKEVILSAGTINSPQILMLSGIGPREELKKHNIKEVANLPVGKKLQCHMKAVLLIKMDKSSDDKGSLEESLKPLVINGFGTLNSSQAYPDFQVVLYSTNALSFAVTCYASYLFNPHTCHCLSDQIQGKDAILITINGFEPKSRGNISLKSSNPEDPPLSYFRDFPDDSELKTYIRYIKAVTRLLDTKFFKNANAELVTLPSCEEFGVGSDEYWDCHMRCLKAGYHFSSTCPMGPQPGLDSEVHSVVDSKLRVHGVRQLRVVDASIMPKIVSANTMVSTIMIGEKGAEMIKKDNK